MEQAASMNNITYIVVKQNSGRYEFIQFHTRVYFHREDMKKYIRQSRKYHKALRRCSNSDDFDVLVPTESMSAFQRSLENPNYKYEKRENRRITNIKRLRKALGNLGGAKVRDITINNKDTIIKVDNCELFKNIYLANENKEMTSSIYDLFYTNYILTSSNEMILAKGNDLYFEMFKDKPDRLIIR
jgi:hypothetical protein